VRAKAAERLADLIDPDRALREAAALAYSDLTTLFDDKGNLLPKEKWPAALRPAIRKIEVVRKNVTAGDGQTDDVLRVEAWDKVKALEMIAKHLGLFEEKVTHEGRIEIGWIK
jgi:phage terminase small subunit